MRRLTGGLGPLRTLAARLGGAPGAAGSGPVVLLTSDNDESAGLTATVDALRHEDPDHATVVVAAGLEGSRALWRQLTPVLDGFRKSGITVVRLVWAGAGADEPGRPAPARRIRDDWRLEVVAPAGPVVVAPGGSLFAPSGVGGTGGWWRFAPDLGPQPLGLRHPVPSWEDAAAHLASDAVEGHVVESVPAGVLIRRAEPLPPAALSVGASIPVDGHRLAVVVGIPGASPVTSRAVTELLTRLPPRARSAARLIPGDGRDLLATGQEAADLLGTEVEIVSGVPALLESADGTETEPAVVLIGPDGEPSWRPYAETVACLPAQDGRTPAPRIVRRRSPVAGSAPVPEGGALPLGDRWGVVVTRSGLWVGPRESSRPETLGLLLDPDTMVVDIGVPGRPVDDGLWPVLDTFLDELEPAVVERTTLHLRGACTAQGGRQARRLADRRGLTLEHDEEPAAEHRTTGGAPRAREGDASAREAARREAAPEVPWHASPMSVRIRHVAAHPPAATGDRPSAVAAADGRAVRLTSTAGGGGDASPSRTADGPGASSPAPAPSSSPARVGGPTALGVGMPAALGVGMPTGRIAFTAPAPAPAVTTAPPGAPTSTTGTPDAHSASPAYAASSAYGAGAPLPPGFAEAFAASRPVGARPVGGPAEGAVSAWAPAAPETARAAPPEGTPPAPSAPNPPSAPSRSAAPAARVGPLHRSGPVEQQALRALAGEQWWQQQAAVARTLTVMPGLRGQDQDDAVLADLIAVRSFLTLDDSPLGRRWLEHRLAAGSADAYPSLVGLASGLRRLPSYRGIVVRDVATFSPEARALTAGTELCHPGPVGAYVLEGAPASAGDRYLIWSTTGRRVRSLTGPAARPGQGEEVVFGPGTRFRFLGTRGGHGASTVLLREVAPADPVARSGEQDASDRGVREQLSAAADSHPTTEGAAPWPDRFSGRLPERAPHRDDHV
ncbi:hypothetical protein [Streptomyces sp. NBC_00102]|uniref:hypothetical protein n=1 Tax=Streptomyces sp. NBC_00102 TaxID=2975652 RepID=UPI00224CCBD1|nr:hypothetical protein [Streptomyces sp. NBC_00102]MCX5401184.1 hypothetical protein [Streptomyces sp. NBC_00102]